jgi:hypothetical protein
MCIRDPAPGQLQPTTCMRRPPKPTYTPATTPMTSTFCHGRPALAAPASTTLLYTAAGGTTPGMGSGMVIAGAAGTGVKSSVAPALSGTPFDGVAAACPPPPGCATGSATARMRRFSGREGHTGRGRETGARQGEAFWAEIMLRSTLLTGRGRVELASH